MPQRETSAQVSGYILLKVFILMFKVKMQVLIFEMVMILVKYQWVSLYTMDRRNI